MRSFDAAASEIVNVDDRFPGRGEESEKRKQIFSFTYRAGTAQKRRKQYTVYAHIQTHVNPHFACSLARAHTSFQGLFATT